MKKEIPPNVALFSLNTVVQLTNLTARQIRYYEKHSLISPSRNKGNQRQFSLNDIDLLVKIKELTDLGVNIAGMKEMLKNREEISDE